MFTFPQTLHDQLLMLLSAEPSMEMKIVDFVM
jgi:hypothetical protein